MKRRNFIFACLGTAGFFGLSGTAFSPRSAIAQDESATAAANNTQDLQLMHESLDQQFRYRGHQISILRRSYRERVYGPSGRVALGAPVERWAMHFNGKELPQSTFHRMDLDGCFFSELLPFHNECAPENLARALVDGDQLQLFRLAR